MIYYINSIGIVVIATNAYFPLGIRFIKKFTHHYKGNSKIIFYFFSDEDPKHYISDNINIKYYQTNHNHWTEGTNSKFKNILSLFPDISQIDYLYYFDADTNVDHDFTEKWFLGEMVGGEHFGNRSFLKDGKGFDRNPISKAYVPIDSTLPYTYYYGAFFGGKTNNVINLCEILFDNQLEDKKIPYEPIVNDESYINQYFHFNPPTLTVKSENFLFNISDKGGIENTRNPNLDISDYKKNLLIGKDRTFDIINKQIIWL